MEKTLAKGLTLLETLARLGHPVGVTEAAKAVGLQKSNAHRLLRSAAQPPHLRARDLDELRAARALQGIERRRALLSAVVLDDAEQHLGDLDGVDLGQRLERAGAGPRALGLTVDARERIERVGEAQLLDGLRSLLRD